MATPTEKLLGNLLSSSKKIEQLLEKQDSKKKDDKGNGEITAEVVGGMTKNMKEMTQSLKNIEKESKKTNVLLKELIEVNTHKKGEVLKEATETSKALSKLGRGVNRLIDAVQVVGKIPDSAVNRFKDIIMISAFLNPKTGDPIATQKQFDNAEMASKSIIHIVGGIALLGATMIGFAFALPQITQGALGFGIVLAGLTLSIFLTSKALQWGSGGLQDTSPLNSIKQLVIGIALLGATMVAFSFVLPQIAWGALGFLTVIAGLTLGIVLMGKALQWGSGGFKDTSPINTLRALITSVAVTGLIMVGFSFILPQILIGSLGFITIIAAITLSLFLMNKVLGKSKTSGMGALVGGGKNLMKAADKKKGSGPLHTLTKLLFGIAITAVVLVGVGFFAKEAALGALVVAGGIGLLALSVRLLEGKNVRNGIMNMTLLTIPLLGFIGALAVYANFVAPKLEMKDVLILGSSIAIMSVIGTALGAPPFEKWAKAGVVNLLLISGALSVFALSLGFYAERAAGKLEWKDIAILGATITGVSLIATVLGIPPIAGFALMGAAALAAIGLSLIPFSMGMTSFTESGFTTEHIIPLTGGITAAGLVATGLGFVFPFAMLGSVALGAIGLALLPFTKGLAIFAESGYDKSDNERLKSAFTGVADAIDSVGFVKMARVGAKALLFRNVGETLTGLAKGIQSFANLTFDTYDLDEETGEMKLRERVRLTPKDIAQTGIAIGMVLDALVDPIIKFGDAMSGSGGGGLFGWGKNDVERGIDSFSSIGGGLVNLATGIQDWANMTVTEYGIQTNKETGLNEIVPVKKRPITHDEIKLATKNIAHVLDGLANPLVEFGKALGSDKGSGLFGFNKSDIERGMKSFEQVSGGLGNLAEGVIAWSRMEYFEQEVVKDPETGLNVLQPKNQAPKKIDTVPATLNIAKVLGALPQPLIDFGNKLTKGWGDPAIVAIEKLGEMSSGLGSLAEVVSNWSFMSYTKMKVDKDGNLVPDKVVEINDIGLARRNIVSALTTLTSPLIAVSNVIEKNGGIIKFMQTLGSMSEINETFGKIAKNIENIWGNDSTVSTGERFRNWVTNVTGASIRTFSFDLRTMASSINILDDSLSKVFRMDFGIGNQPFDKFTTNIEKLSGVAKDFASFVDSFDRMAISMGVFAENFNMMDARGITAFGIWTDTLTKAIEIGKESEKGMFDNFLDSAKATVENAFSLGDSLFGSSSDAMTADEKQSVIDKTLSDEGPDPVAQKLEALDATIRALSGEINTLKAVMSGTLDVNISGVDSNAARKMRD